MLIGQLESPEFHKEKFVEFAKASLLVGDPDSHLKVIAGTMNDIEERRAKVWLAFCYTAFYNVVSGIIVYSNWPLTRVLQDPEGFKHWLEANWRWFEISFERRTVRSSDKMWHSLMTCAKACDEGWPDVNRTYEELWKESEIHLMYYGRYITIKLLETLYQAGVISVRLPDIRPAGGWSLRITLSWLYPQHKTVCLHGNSAQDIIFVNKLVDDLMAHVQKATSPEVSIFEIEVWLCTYRQLYESIHGCYPGFSQDNILAQYYRLRKYWGELDLDLLGIRSKLFSPYTLGEVQGWQGPRGELNVCHQEHDYFWCDVLHDFSATLDYQRPVLRQ